MRNMLWEILVYTWRRGTAGKVLCLEKAQMKPISRDGSIFELHAELQTPSSKDENKETNRM